MSMDSSPSFIGIGGAAAGAGIATAIAGLLITTVPIIVPILGGVAALVALKLSGTLDNPEKVIFGSSQNVDTEDAG